MSGGAAYDDAPAPGGPTGCRRYRSAPALLRPHVCRNPIIVISLKQALHGTKHQYLRISAKLGPNWIEIRDRCADSSRQSETLYGNDGCDGSELRTRHILPMCFERGAVVI